MKVTQEETSGSLISPPSSGENCIKNQRKVFDKQRHGTDTKHHQPTKDNENTYAIQSAYCAERCVHKRDKTNLCKTNFMQELC